MDKERLGKLLVAAGLISLEQLKHALEQVNS
jgi:hypothetical protein